MSYVLEVITSMLQFSHVNIIEMAASLKFTSASFSSICCTCKQSLRKDEPVNLTLSKVQATKARQQLSLATHIEIHIYILHS